jgi:hypothetical protein
LQKMLVAVQALQSQISFLKSLDRNDVSNGISGLSQYLAKVNSSINKRDLLTVESRVGHLYFRNYVKLFEPKYGFTRDVVAGACVCACVFVCFTSNRMQPMPLITHF